ncbi:glycoside hydrolase [Coprinellus micaceus]|uniref:mannosyl-oligosaccharide 1,2-alpha-mannosidase n=1 Tax=Coprinellus micaceus TaxID=71717 RepID=A0A4Y7T6N9_COPMI|nr:glycoside hydrolase [Coprinellus micaceus]
MVNLHEKKGVGEEYQKWLVSTAEAATLQLEFKYLAHLTDNDECWVKAEKVMKVIKDALVNIESGLAPIYMNAEQGDFITSEIRLGSRGDSFYEYLLKQYLQTNRTEEVYLEMYENTMDSIRANLVRKGINKHSTYTVELLPQRVNKGEMSWKVSPKQDHLVCFLAGSLNARCRPK